MGFARELAHRIVFMRAGEVVDVLEPEVFSAEPVTGASRPFASQLLH